ncbi:MAG: ABC transporter permease [Firmicutes bacterium]|nr:ABC transporter permease [Bacillota bacterium]
MRKLKGLLLPIIIIFIWSVFSRLGMVNSFILPSPESILHTGFALLKKGILLKHLGVSLLRVLFGFILAFILAFPLAVVSGLNKKIHEYIEPSLEFIRHIPPIATIPLLILWFGIGESSKLAVIILATFFPIYLNTYTGVSESSIDLEEVGVVFGYNKWDIFRRIILPQAMPSVLTGIQLGLGYSWRSLMGAELIAASSGIGYMIIEAEQLSRIDIIFVGILVIGILGQFIDVIFIKLTDKYFRLGVKDSGKDRDKELVESIQY